MVLFPRKGKVYWYVTDIWETFVAVPVVVEHGKMAGFNGFPKPCKSDWRKLYSSQKKAQIAAIKLNRKESP